MQRKIIRRSVADKTREKIIKTATKLFAKRGFSATPTQTIAKLAKVNETLIFHHFGSKAELWKKVKEQVVQSIEVIPLDPKPKSLHIFLESIVHQRLTVYRQKPELVRLLQWQRLESSQEELVAGNILAPTHWLPAIKHLQTIGEIKANVPPDIILIWLLVSVNAVIFDNIPFFKEENNKKKYIDFLLDSFEKVLNTPYPT